MIKINGTKLNKNYILISFQENNVGSCVESQDSQLFALSIFLEDFYYHSNIDTIKDRINRPQGCHVTGNGATIDVYDGVVEIYLISSESPPGDAIFKTNITDFNRILYEFDELYKKTPRPFEIIIYRDKQNNNKITLTSANEKFVEIIHRRYIRFSLKNNVLTFIQSTNMALFMLFLFFEHYYLFGAKKIKDMVNNKIDWQNHDNRLAIDFENNIIRISFISELPLNEEKIFKTDIADFNRIVDEFCSLYERTACPYDILIYFDEFNNDKVTLVNID